MKETPGTQPSQKCMSSCAEGWVVKNVSPTSKWKLCGSSLRQVSLQRKLNLSRPLRPTLLSTYWLCTICRSTCLSWHRHLRYSQRLIPNSLQGQIGQLQVLAGMTFTICTTPDRPRGPGEVGLQVAQARSGRGPRVDLQRRDRSKKLPS